MKKISNLVRVIAFLIIYKIINIIVVSPLLCSLFNFLIKISGFTNIYYGNIGKIFLNPIMLIGFLIIIVFFAFWTLFGIIFLINIYSYNRDKNQSILDVLKFSINRCNGLFLFKRNNKKSINRIQEIEIMIFNNAFIILFMVFLSFVLNFSLLNSFISVTGFPTFMKHHMIGSIKFWGVFLLLSFITVIIFIELKNVLYYYITNNVSFKEAVLIVPNRKEKIDNELVYYLFTYIFRAAFVVVLIICAFLVELFCLCKMNVLYIKLFNMNDKNVLITGHRGARNVCPENTMVSFETANKYGADWIELDLWKLADDTIIVMHDKNFLRTCGVRKSVYSVSYNEVKDYDAGFLFNEKYKGEKVPLFLDVLEFAKDNNVKLHIEVKSDLDGSLITTVIDLLNDYGMKDKCIIGSKDYRIVKHVKEVDNSIKTSFIMDYGFGDLSIFEAADGISLCSIFWTSDMINRVHESGKNTFAWTVNTKDNMCYMDGIGVDNYITDNILLCKEYINSK